MRISNKHSIEGRQIVENVLLSEGAYGYIFKAQDLQTGQTFALKKMFCQVIKQIYQESQETIKVAQNELSIMRKLPKHPNLVQFYGGQLGKSEQGVAQALMLMEFCSEGSLFDLMAKNPNQRFEEDKVLNILENIVQGLKAMHSLNPPLAHRDIKIENVLFQDSKYKLCDFGSSSEQRVDFSKIDKNDFSHYEEDYEKNTTLMYRPPEMADLYQRYEVTEKVDIWMLGCVIFTLCYFIHPFQECSKLAIVNATYNFPKLSNVNQSITISIAKSQMISQGQCLLLILKLDHQYLKQIKSSKIFQPLNLFSQMQILFFDYKNQAQEIKNREGVLDKEMEIYQYNSQKIKHFDGDIPFDELLKLQQKIKQDQSLPSRIPQKAPQMLNQQTIRNDFQQQSFPNIVTNQITNDIWGSFNQQNQVTIIQIKIKNLIKHQKLMKNDYFDQFPNNTAKQTQFDGWNSSSQNQDANNWGFGVEPQISSNQSWQNISQNLVKNVNLLEIADDDTKKQQNKFDLSNIIL